MRHRRWRTSLKGAALEAGWRTGAKTKAPRPSSDSKPRAADTDRDGAFQRFQDALAEHFGPDEMLGIVGVVVNMNVWTRIKLAEGAMPVS